MRIVNSVLGDATGGRWQVVCDYSRILAGAGHRVLLLLGRQYPPDPADIPPGVDIERISNRGHYDFVAAWRTRSLLRGFAPELAVAHCSRSVALLKRALGAGTPVVAVSHSHKVRRLTPADACLALNGAIRQRFEALAPGKPCVVLPNSIRISGGLPSARAAHRPPRIGALGRLDPVKGFDVFIDALGWLAREDRPFEAVLGGAGPDREALQRRATALGLSDRLTFCGWVQDIDGFLADVDVLCVPARSDAFGLTPLQAARAGVPLVLSAAEGHREMFEADGGEALFAEIGDSRATAAQLARLLDDPALAERLRGAAFRRVAEQYSEAAAAAKLQYIFDKLINNRQHKIDSIP